MAQILFTVDIPDSANLATMRTRVVNAFALVYSYRATLPNGDPNPETKAQFAKRQVALFVREVVKQAEVAIDVNAARTAAAAKTDQEIVVS